MDDRLSQFVRLRAAYRCEYCLLPEGETCGVFEVEHIIPIQHGGTNLKSNLAWACRRCNRYKGTNVAGYDTVKNTTRLVRLFHPRRHYWDYHFRIERSAIVGRTAIGRVTIALLSMNESYRMALRQELTLLELFP